MPDLRIAWLLCFLLWPLAGTAARLPDPVEFSVAIERGDLSQAREWLDAGLAPDFEGHLIGTGVMIGAWEGNIRMMALFHARGADLNKVNRFGEQALLHAAWRGKQEAVRWLLDRGARVNRTGKAWSALHYAVFAGHGEVVGNLLARGADVNAPTVNGATPLMMAAREGREEIAARLVEAGARRDIVDDNGDNATQWAMRNNQLRIARVIAGADRFAELAKRPPPAPPRVQRSVPLPDKADQLLAQARALEAEGKRDQALTTYQAALALIRQPAAPARAAAEPPPRPAEATRMVTGIAITARRAEPRQQAMRLTFGSIAVAKVGADGTATAPAAAPRPAAGGDMRVDDLLRQARDLEVSGRRAEALQAYRQASFLLRDGPRPAVVPPAPVKADLNP